jgi:hypothetical protein
VRLKHTWQQPDSGMHSGDLYHGAATAMQEVWFCRRDLRVVVGEWHECPVQIFDKGGGLGLTDNLGSRVGSIV